MKIKKSRLKRQYLAENKSHHFWFNLMMLSNKEFSLTFLSVKAYKSSPLPPLPPPPSPSLPLHPTVSPPKVRKIYVSWEREEVQSSHELREMTSGASWYTVWTPSPTKPTPCLSLRLQGNSSISQKLLYFVNRCPYSLKLHFLIQSVLS